MPPLYQSQYGYSPGPYGQPGQSPYGQPFVNTGQGMRGSMRNPYLPPKPLPYDLTPPTSQDYLQEKFGGMMRRAGKGGVYNFGGMGLAPGRVSAYQTAPPQSLNAVPAGMPYGATSPGALPSNQGYTTQGQQSYSQITGQQSVNPGYYSQQISQQNPMMPQLLALLQQLLGNTAPQ